MTFRARALQIRVRKEESGPTRGMGCLYGKYLIYRRHNNQKFHRMLI